LQAARTPRGRAEALIDASFTASSFDPATIVAWMTLYAQAATNRETNRLLRLYQMRLHGNLRHALRPLSATPDADAAMLGALIDGLYLRAALGGASGAKDTAHRALDQLIGARQ
ncbi:MAG: TetR family transcriptional regulator C-terminal domain-containing protein, partial [Pseudomonadota bacterium]